MDRSVTTLFMLMSVDGKSLLSENELTDLGVLKLQKCVILEDSYLRLRYEVIH